MQPIRNFDQLLQCAKGRGSKGIAVAVPYDKNTLLAVKDALDSGLTTAQLFGDQSRILPILEQIGLSASAVSICHVEETHQAIETAIASIRDGKNQILMKGTVSTGTLLKHALDKAKGLNIGRLASHLIVLQIPGFDRLLISTDGGLNIAPTLMEKADILRNAIDVAHALGIETPKAACLCKMADRGGLPRGRGGGPPGHGQHSLRRSGQKEGHRF